MNDEKLKSSLSQRVASPKAKLKGLSLFSGIGGIELALSDWVETKAYCEIDPYAQAVLRSRMANSTSFRCLDKQPKEHPTKAEQQTLGQPSCCLNPAPIHPDITKLHGKLGEFDIITGGFPCQDISNAGKRKGITGKRSGLWFEMHRLISEIRPRYVFVENVSALINRGLPEVLASLAEIGYDAIWLTLRASDVGAPHRRDRVFILAYPDSQRWSAGANPQREHANILSKIGQAEENQQSGGGRLDWSGPICESDVSNGISEGLEGEFTQSQTSWKFRLQNRTNRQQMGFWQTDPADLPDPKCLRLECPKEQRNVGETSKTPTGNQQCKSAITTQKSNSPSGTRQNGCGEVATDREVKSRMGELVDGLPAVLDSCGYGYTPRVTSETAWRVERLKCLGNAVVPQQAREAFIRLTQIKEKLK
jgi:DNA-cytosine methyltransferase